VNEWDRDASWAELTLLWLLRWGGMIFFTLTLGYLAWSIYVWLRPL
jgi:hypothetical protein